MINRAVTGGCIHKSGDVGTGLMRWQGTGMEAQNVLLTELEVKKF